MSMKRIPKKKTFLSTAIALIVAGTGCVTPPSTCELATQAVPALEKIQNSLHDILPRLRQDPQSIVERVNLLMLCDSQRDFLQTVYSGRSWFSSARDDLRNHTLDEGDTVSGTSPLAAEPARALSQSMLAPSTDSIENLAEQARLLCRWNQVSANISYGNGALDREGAESAARELIVSAERVHRLIVIDVLPKVRLAQRMACGYDDAHPIAPPAVSSAQPHSSTRAASGRPESGVDASPADPSSGTSGAAAAGPGMMR